MLLHSGINFKFHGHLRNKQVHYVEMAQILTGS